jgi:hypothetical protein
LIGLIAFISARSGLSSAVLSANSASPNFMDEWEAMKRKSMTLMPAVKNKIARFERSTGR